MPTGRQEAEAKIQRVLARLDARQVDQLAPDGGDFGAVAEAVMAWWALLMASGAVRKSRHHQQTVAGAAVVLGTLVKYAYALGVVAERHRHDEHRS